MNSDLKFICGCIAVLLIFSGCSHSESADAVDEPSPVTPVQVTTIQDSSLAEFVELSAVSAYLEKSFVKANINGYIESTQAITGKQVGSHQLLFSLITKEAKSIGNSVNKLDAGFKFSGISNIRADQAGTIVQVNHQKGDYVQDGEALATISNRNSLVFLLDLPYEYNQLINQNKTLAVLLPDGTKMTGTVSGTMPSVDSAAQTQRYILKVGAGNNIPEGLIAKVRLTKVSHTQAQVLPKSAVLANETEDEFWVMKLINDSTAVKVKVKRGIENQHTIEVLEPKFSKKDRIITSGNYGIADTAKVKIQQ
ncbi:HlyD family efflux transporter periplasmic adaptor subunit [Pedobacter sp. HDW13]|uniref:efflux RND transporter periplasmic adaptor subunit n=1 Tax=unclassified Pedobacter TaxID=2628915 RepID=UPI000F5915F0|nr:MULTISPECIES: HlyD family efflux transporter periplasmic adaptor subunit [unclassified Pedobacter]QIL41417.1 HlyD family efflux transporter periplasmic adaptor subunit [Pedobacter sp. HDW13]RQO78010.1 RND transporter [Pedobacter sp. KBW01]